MPVTRFVFEEEARQGDQYPAGQAVPDQLHSAGKPACIPRLMPVGREAPPRFIGMWE